MSNPRSLAETIDSLEQSFSAFKEGQSRDVAGLQGRVRTLETHGARVTNAGGDVDTADRPEARAAFKSFLRGGEPRDMTKFAPQAALSTPSGPDGGFAIPQEIASEIEKLERSLSPLRRLAKIRPVTTDRPEQLVNVGGVGSGWVGERSARSDTASDELSLVTPTMGEIFALPSATQRIIDDATFDIDSFVAESVAEEFAVQEGAAFASGDGIQKPRGFLTYPTSTAADSARALGTLQYVNTGTSGAFGATEAGGILIDLVHSLRAPYRQGAAWLMNSATLAVVRKLKDGDSNFLWRPGLLAGQPDSLLGYPIGEDENMPDIGANTLSIAFGNWQRGYVICDHVTGVRMLRDPFTTKGYVKFYTTKRVGGCVVNSQAIKLLKFAA